MTVDWLVISDGLCNPVSRCRGLVGGWTLKRTEELRGAYAVSVAAGLQVHILSDVDRSENL